jgi:hypothetical protein
MQNPSEKSQKPDLKEINISTPLTFCKLPTEDSSFDIESNEKNNIRTCKKLRVSFKRVYIPAVYGSKSKKLERDENNVKNVENFLLEFYEDQKSSGENDSDDETNKSESFADWKNRVALQRIQILLSQRARIDALRTETADVGKQVAALENSIEADKLDMDALDRLQAMLDKARAKAQAA